MQNVRLRQVNAKIASKREQIHPQYRLENESIFICIPSIRLPEITQRPILKLYQMVTWLRNARYLFMVMRCATQLGNTIYPL